MISSNHPLQPRLSSALRRHISSMLGAHLIMHLSSLPKRQISLTYRPASNLRQRPGHIFAILSALCVYGTTLSTLSRFGFRDLTFLGYLLLIESPPGDKFLVEASTPEGSSPVLRVISGPTVDRFCKTLAKAQTLYMTKRRELRLLRITALHLSAVWGCIPDRSDQGWFIPYGANVANVKQGRSYRFLRFESRLKSASIQQILRWYQRYEEEQHRSTQPSE